MHVDAGPSIVCKGKMGKVTCFITSLYKLSKRVVTDIDGSFGKWAEMTSSTKRQSKFSIYIDLHRDVQVAPPKNLLETNHFKLDEKFIHRRLELEQQETPQMAGSSTHLEPSQKMLFCDWPLTDSVYIVRATLKPRDYDRIKRLHADHTRYPHRLVLPELMVECTALVYV